MPSPTGQGQEVQLGDRGEARRGRRRLLARGPRVRTELADDNAVDPLGHGSTVWMQELDPAKPLRHAMHVDVSVAREHVEARLAAALAAGGRIVDDADAPQAGSSPTAPATACASPPGPTGSFRLPDQHGGKSRTGTRRRPSRAGESPRQQGRLGG